VNFSVGVTLAQFNACPESFCGNNATFVKVIDV
jgi:hypothetical protein